MLQKFNNLSTQYHHRGVRGEYREEIVCGEIFDVNGLASSQCDVMIIDAERVPKMFAKTQRFVSAEGVYAVLEVKSKLDSEQLQDCLDRCRKIKALEKRAYVSEDGDIETGFHLYGNREPHFPKPFRLPLYLLSPSACNFAPHDYPLSLAVYGA